MFSISVAYKCLKHYNSLTSVEYYRHAGVPETASCTDGKIKDTLTMSDVICAMKRMNTMHMLLISLIS